MINVLKSKSSEEASAFVSYNHRGNPHIYPKYETLDGNLASIHHSYHRNS